MSNESARKRLQDCKAEETALQTETQKLQEKKKQGGQQDQTSKFVLVQR